MAFKIFTARQRRAIEFLKYMIGEIKDSSGVRDSEMKIVHPPDPIDMETSITFNVTYFTKDRNNA